MNRLKELVPIVRVPLRRAAQLTKFLCFLHVSTTYVGSVVPLVGPSMLPTLAEGDIVLKESVTKRLGKVGLGDVVILRAPDVPWKLVAKRIKGVEGDEISYLVDSKRSDELKTVVVPKGHIWVEGDNASNSRDSRQFGPVPYAMVLSRIVCVIWPPRNFGLIGSKVPTSQNFQ